MGSPDLPGLSGGGWFEVAVMSRCKCVGESTTRENNNEWNLSTRSIQVEKGHAYVVQNSQTISSRYSYRRYDVRMVATGVIKHRVSVESWSKTPWGIKLVWWN